MAFADPNERFHADQIAVILGNRFQSHGLPVKIKPSELIDMTLQGLALRGMHKPFLMSKERFIVLSVLMNRQVYTTVSPVIELVASVDGVDMCWDGTGRFKQRQFLRDLTALGLLSESVDESLMEINIQPVLLELKNLLEWPSASGA